MPDFVWKLSSAIDLDSSDAFERISRNPERQFVWIKRRITDDEAERIQKLDLPKRSWGFRREYLRKYQSSISRDLSTNTTDWNYQRADYTIRWLDLNYKRLKKARKKLWIECVDKIREIQDLLDENNKNPSANRKTKIKEKMNALKQMTSPEAEFSATSRECLLKSGKPWAIRLTKKK